MAIPCPNCGRQYDVTLFQYGRTIACTCGARVGRRLEVSLPARGTLPRFMVDVMLGRLARWLRVIGCDAAYEEGIEDAELVRRAVEERRIVLTRDRALPGEWWIDNFLLIESEAPMEQLQQVVRVFALPWSEALFTRCTLCNDPLQVLDAREMERCVPPRVRRLHAGFSRCPSCGRLYWKGSHVERMRRRLDELFGPPGGAASSGGTSGTA